MSLFYKAKQSTVASKDGKKRWFPTLVKPAKAVSTRKVAKALAALTTLNEGDVYNVMMALSPVLFDLMKQSRSVKLEGVGTFTLKSSSGGNGVETAEEVNPNQINYLKVQFTPEYTRPMGVGKTRSQFEDVEYVRWDKEALPKADDQSGNGDDDDWQDPDS